MKTISVAILFGLVLIPAAAFPEDWDIVANDLDAAKQAAITQCVDKNPGATRLRCGLVPCSILGRGRAGCNIPTLMSDEDLAYMKEIGYSDDGTRE